MAKNDDKRARGRIDVEQGRAQGRLDHTWDDLVIPQAQEIWNNYKTATDLGFKDYGNLMSGFEGFQKNGGYSSQDLSNIRRRATSPISSIYANANREVDRAKSVSGYSPNYNATKAKMAREASYAIGDQQANTEGMLAEMVNKGKQFGLSGGSNLYGTAPGMASTFGNQALNATQNWLQAQGLQNQLGLGTMNAQINAGNLRGKWQQLFDNSLSAGQTIGAIAGGFNQ